jgi:stage IV sporulation protein FB
MRDPFAWSWPLLRLFGIQVKVNILFPFFALALVLREACRDKPEVVPGAWIDAAMVIGLLFFSVLVHEFGHCFAARRVGGDATEVVLWPLGGLANVDLPHQPRAHFLTAAAGPAANVLLGAAALVALQFVHPDGAGGRLQPSWNPFYYTARETNGLVPLHTWSGALVHVSPYSSAAVLAWLVWVNYFAFVFNILLVGFPMDAGRMLQSVVWSIWGYRQGMFVAIFWGYITMLGVGLYSVVRQEMIALCLALFIYRTCTMQWIILETGGEDSPFGYDFSQGYTSLERDLPSTAPARPRRMSWWQRYQKNRTAKRRERQEAERVSDERRMDELLEKVQREGITALTDEERRFMKRVSDRYRNRH